MDVHQEGFHGCSVRSGAQSRHHPSKHCHCLLGLCPQAQMLHQELTVALSAQTKHQAAAHRKQVGWGLGLGLG